ncbi:MAG: DUF1800 domain-containing protein [Pirellulales bacterium]
MTNTALASTDAWLLYEPTDSAPWNVRRIVRLHRRAGFAANWSEIQRDLADGPGPAVERLLCGQAREVHTHSDFETMARTIGDAAQASGNPDRLMAWWLYRILLSSDPLTERLALMWHNHFATSNRKVQDLVLMREQNELFRAHGRGPFGELLGEVVKHPAMLVWLDADSNRKGKPNENLARELMELFTLGIGNYTERDVKDAARAFSGWTITSGGFQYKPTWHDDGEKEILGHVGDLNGEALLDILLEHPATARRLAWRLCQTLLGEDVALDADIDALAAGMIEHDLDIAWGVETILRSQLFFSDAACGRRISGPTEWAVAVLHALELCDPPPSTLLVAEWVSRMGQELFYPPNVGGWSEGRAWYASRMLVARANFAATLATGSLWQPTRAPALQQLVERHRGASDLPSATAWFAELLWGHVPDGTVAEILSATESNDGNENLANALAVLLARPESHLT